jgi:hypothetical protein
VIDSNLMFVTAREESGSQIQIPNSLFFQKIFRVIGDDRRRFGALDSTARFARQGQQVGREADAGTSPLPSY